MMWRGRLFLMTSNDTGRSVALVSVKWIGLSGGSSSSSPASFHNVDFLPVAGMGGTHCSTPQFPRER